MASGPDDLYSGSWNGGGGTPSYDFKNQTTAIQVLLGGMQLALPDFSPPPTTSPSSSMPTAMILSSSKPIGAIVGGVIGGIIILALAFGILFLYFRMEKRKRSESFLHMDPVMSPSSETPGSVIETGQIAQPEPVALPLSGPNRIRHPYAQVRSEKQAAIQARTTIQTQTTTQPTATSQSHTRSPSDEAAPAHSANPSAAESPITFAAGSTGQVSTGELMDMLSVLSDRFRRGEVPWDNRASPPDYSHPFGHGE